jgi:hypothetical protein
MEERKKNLVKLIWDSRSRQIDLYSYSYSGAPSSYPPATMMVSGAVTAFIVVALVARTRPRKRSQTHRARRCGTLIVLIATATERRQRRGPYVDYWYVAVSTSWDSGNASWLWGPEPCCLLRTTGAHACRKVTPLYVDEGCRRTTLEGVASLQWWINCNPPLHWELSASGKPTGTCRRARRRQETLSIRTHAADGPRSANPLPNKLLDLQFFLIKCYICN